MIRNELIIGVQDVQRSSQWYQDLLGCQSKHGGDTFEVLADEHDNVFLCLHKWGEHEHPTLRQPDPVPGNGMILYLRVDDLEKVWKNARELRAVVDAEPHRNENSGKDEFAIRDPDGYYLLISV